MNSAQSKDAGLLPLASIDILDQRQKSDDEHLWEKLTAGLTNQDQLLRVFIPVFAAILLGGITKPPHWSVPEDLTESLSRTIHLAPRSAV
jgi:hypothetical protein